MSKLIRLIYVNILDLINYNKLSLAKESGIHDSSELKIVTLGVVGVAFGLILYYLFMFLGNLVIDKYIILALGFFLGTFVTFVVDILQSENVLFGATDIEMLYSLPLTKKQIVLSKLFKVYVKNIVIIFIIMLPCIIAFSNYGLVSETSGLFYILSSLVIPLIPIILSTLIAYVNCYFRINKKYKVFYYLVLLLIISLLGFLLWNNLKTSNLEKAINNIFQGISIGYPLLIFFNKGMKTLNIFYILITLLIPIFLAWLFIKLLSFNYLRMLSLLKGIKINRKFVLKKAPKHRPLFSILKKEKNNLLNNKMYLKQNLVTPLIGMFLFVIVCCFWPSQKFENMEYYMYYIYSYIPGIVMFLGTVGCLTISSLSLERDNILILRTLPVNMGLIIWGKILFNVLIHLVFILIEIGCLRVFLGFSIKMILITLFYSLSALLFTSLLGITLDLVFNAWESHDENMIIRQRLITFVPILISGFFALLPFLLPVYTHYDFFIIALGIVLLLGCLVNIGYLISNGKKLVKKLFT